MFEVISCISSYIETGVLTISLCVNGSHQMTFIFFVRGGIHIGGILYFASKKNIM